MARPPLVAYFGHHKCASTWMSLLMSDIAHIGALRFAHTHDPAVFGDNTQTFVDERDLDILSFTEASYLYVEGLTNFRAFNLIRDPRDIVVSAYFSHLHTHPTDTWPELVAHRESLKTHSQAEGLRLEIDFLDVVFEHLTAWNYEDPRIMTLKMEDVIQNPYDTILDALCWTGLVDEDANEFRERLSLNAMRMANRAAGASRGIITRRARMRPLPAREVLRAIRRHRFSVLSGGRERGVEDVHHHYRKGIAGDWVNYFEPVHKEYFKARHGELLVTLGYESGLDW